MSNYYTELVEKAKKAIVKAKALKKKNPDTWLNAKEVSDIIGYCRYWVYKKMESENIKSKIDDSKGNGKKVYRIIHIDWFIDFLTSIIGDARSKEKTSFKDS